MLDNFGVDSHWQTEAMRRATLLLSFFALADVLGTGAPWAQTAPTSLNVRLSEPLRWTSGCLAAKLESVNNSSVPLYINGMGPYFDIAMDVSKDDSQTGDEIEWVNIFGITDMVDEGSDSLAPGSTLHRTFCFRPTVWVFNMKRNTRREIPVRGKMRISVSYFTREEDSANYRKFHETGPTLQWTTIYTDIPCPETSCKADCDKPPMGVRGEGRMVPDIGEFFAEPNVRGKKLADELSGKFPPCSPKSINPQGPTISGPEESQ